MFSMSSLMHVKSIEGSEYCWTLSARVREGVWKMSTLNMVAHIAHGVIGELLTDGTWRFASRLVSCHINIEVLGLCDVTLNKTTSISICHISSCGKSVPLWWKHSFGTWDTCTQKYLESASTLCDFAKCTLTCDWSFGRLNKLRHQLHGACKSSNHLGWKDLKMASINFSWPKEQKQFSHFGPDLLKELPRAYGFEQDAECLTRAFRVLTFFWQVGHV